MAKKLVDSLFKQLGKRAVELELAKKYLLSRSIDKRKMVEDKCIGESEVVAVFEMLEKGNFEEFVEKINKIVPAGEEIR